MNLLLAIFLLGTTCAAAQDAPEPAIDSVAEVRDCVRANSGEGRPFDLTARVAKGETPPFIAFHVVQDGNFTELHFTIPSPSISAGDLVRVRGQLVQTKLGVQAHVREFDHLGAGEPPQPASRTAEELFSGQHDGEYVRIEGEIADAFYDDIDTHFSSIILVCDGTTLYVPLAERPPLDALHRLIGAHVSIAGFCNRPPSIRANLNREVDLSSLDDITILKPAQANPFDVPELFGNTPTASRPSSFRRRAAGRVLAAWQGNRCLLKTADGKLVTATFLRGETPAVGDSVEAVGNPVFNAYDVNLMRATWRARADLSVPLEPAADARAADLKFNKNGLPQIAAHFHGRPLVLRGTICGLSTLDANDPIALLQDDSAVIRLHEGSARGLFRKLEIGAQVEVVGICAIEVDEIGCRQPTPAIRSIFLVLRDERDLTILARPTWWTPARLLTALGLMAAVLLAILLWNRLLKRQVDMRSKALLEEQIAHVSADLKTIERTRLAVELHDSLSQNLTGIALELQTARELVNEDPALAARHLDIANRSVTSCREELRNCLRDLRIAALEAPDVNEAIRLTLDPITTGGATVAIRFNVPRERISDNTMHAILRIIRELVSNAIRHGDAREIKVAGAIENETLLFSVSDNGKGFDPGNSPGVREGHFGLQGVRERVRSFGGQVTIASQVGRGAKVTVSIALPQEEPTCKS